MAAEGAGLVKKPMAYYPDVYTLTTMQQSKFNKEEKKFILNQALAHLNMNESLHVSKIEFTYKSQNMLFFVTKEPKCQVNADLMAKICTNRKYEPNRTVKLIEQEEQYKLAPRPPNLLEYLINRGKPLNLGDIQVIAYDLLMSLHQIHSKGIAHLDLNPLNLLVIDEIDR